MNVFDILMDDDLIFEDGDFAVGESTLQHQKDLLIATKGSYKANPDVGVSLVDFINDESPEALLKAVKNEFLQDGMNIENLTIENNKLVYKAQYQ